MPVTRQEFYISLGVIAILLGFILFTNNNNEPSLSEIERARIEIRDSVNLVKRDSAFARALQYELMADSLQAIINRKKLDIIEIKKKYESEKKDVLVLDADSTLSLFQSSVTH